MCAKTSGAWYLLDKNDSFFSKRTQFSKMGHCLNLSKVMKNYRAMIKNMDSTVRNIEFEFQLGRLFNFSVILL